MASKISQELQKLKQLAEAKGERLLPEAVVEAAKSKDSPLHSSFEWEDSVAAHKYRLWQARQLIVTVHYEENPRQHYFVSLKSDRKEGGGYRTVVEVLDDDDLRIELLEDAKGDMLIFKKKYSRLKELAEVFAAMEKIIEPELVTA